MVVPIPDAPAAEAAPASTPAAAPATVASPAAATATPPVSTPSGATGGTDAGSQSAAEGATPDPLNDLTEWSEDEKKNFGEQINALPPDLQKTFKKLLTTKTQTIAGVRATVQAQAQLLQSLKDDPIGTATKIIEDAKKAGAQPGQPLDAASTTTMAAEAAGSEAVSQMREALGEELGFLADKLAPVVEQLAIKAAQKQLEPLLQGAEAAEQQARVTEAETTATAFVGRHKDWEQHSARMTELAKEVQFADNVPAGDRLERLYTLASAGAKDGDKTKEVLDRMAASDRAAAASSAVPGVPASRVTSKSTELLTAREAFDAAKREVGSSARA